MNLAEYGRMHDAEDRQWWYAGMRAISFGLLDAALPPPGDPPSSRGAAPLRFLDAGCGTGRNLEELRTRGAAVGVDLAEEALRFCRSRGVMVARGNLLALPFPEGRFDALVSFDVLYHAWVADDRAAMGELFRVLRPGGLLLMRVPALRALWGAHDTAVHSRHRYTAGEVRTLLEGAGLEVVRLSYCNSLLFPLLLVRRTLDRLTGREGSDVQLLPAPLEWLFRHALLAEAALLRLGLSFPVGASVVALARRR